MSVANQLEEKSWLVNKTEHTHGLTWSKCVPLIAHKCSIRWAWAAFQKDANTDDKREEWKKRHWSSLHAGQGVEKKRNEWEEETAHRDETESSR